MTLVTRFAPSPTGLLHIGSAYSALVAAQCARDRAGRFLLRIEDIDLERCRPEFDAALLEDLAWLGLTWEQPVRRQSEHFEDYRAAIRQLDALHVLYPCFCSRKEIRAEIRAAGHAPHAAPSGPEGPLYPGTCRHLDPLERDRRIQQGDPYVLRLDAQRAIAQTGPLTWYDDLKGEQEMSLVSLGDVVLTRKGSPTSYHLSVTVDDHLQGVTLVTRGEDLFSVTSVHRLLQGLLGYQAPTYHHHPLVTDNLGQRLSKRDKSISIRALREMGKTPQQVRDLAYAGI